MIYWRLGHYDLLLSTLDVRLVSPIHPGMCSWPAERSQLDLQGPPHILPDASAALPFRDAAAEPDAGVSPIAHARPSTSPSVKSNRAKSSFQIFLAV